MALRWKVLALVFLARSGLGVQFQTLNSLGVELQSSLSINLQQFGWLVGLFMFAGIFLSFPAGFLGRYISDRKIISLGLGLLALGGVVGTLGNQYFLLAAGRIISGAGFVLGTLYFAKVISDWFEGRELATAMGVLVMSWPIGIALAQVSVPWISDSMGWQYSFYASSLWCCVGAIVIAYMLPPVSDAVPPADNLAGTTSKVLHSPTSVKTEFTSTHWILTILAAIAWGAFNAGFVVYLSFIDARLLEQGFSTVKSSLYASIPSWIMPITAILAGQWVDRAGTRYLCISISAIGAILSMLLLGYTSFSLLGVLLFGILGASAAGVIMALTVDAMPGSSRAFGMGIFFTIYFVCVLPAPAIAGWLGDLNESAGIALAFGALLFLLSAVSAHCFRWYGHRSSPQTLTSAGA